MDKRCRLYAFQHFIDGRLIYSLSLQKRLRYKNGSLLFLYLIKIKEIKYYNQKNKYKMLDKQAGIWYYP